MYTTSINSFCQEESFANLSTLNANYIPCVPKERNPPNVLQVRPIEDLWGVLKQMVHTQSYEAKNLDQLQFEKCGVKT